MRGAAITMDLIYVNGAEKTLQWYNYVIITKEIAEDYFMLANDHKINVRNYYYIIEVNGRRNRLYLTLMDYWQDQSKVSDFISDIQEAIQEMSTGFTILADLTCYNGTSKELHYLHIEAQKLAVEAGVSRVGEVFPANPVIKVFSDAYSKETGAKTMAFNDKEHAERWLDFY